MKEAAHAYDVRTLGGRYRAVKKEAIKNGRSGVAANRAINAALSVPHQGINWTRLSILCLGATDLLAGHFTLSGAL